VEALRDGWSIYALSQHLGHTSVKTTEIYLAFLTPEEADRAKNETAQKSAQSRRFRETG
jgi:integrase/recombinase XerD